MVKKFFNLIPCCNDDVTITFELGGVNEKYMRIANGFGHFVCPLMDYEDEIKTPKLKKIPSSGDIDSSYLRMVLSVSNAFAKSIRFVSSGGKL